MLYQTCPSTEFRDIYDTALGGRRNMSSACSTEQNTGAENEPDSNEQVQHKRSETELQIDSPSTRSSSAP
jgi:hypothetical protein